MTSDPKDNENGLSASQESTKENSQKRRRNRDNHREPSVVNSVYELKGNIEKMNGHTFVRHGEINTSTQYTDTMSQFGRYTTHT